MLLTHHDHLERPPIHPLAHKGIFDALHSGAPVQGHKAEAQQLVLIYVRPAGEAVLRPYYQHHLIFLIRPHLQVRMHTWGPVSGEKALPRADRSEANCKGLTSCDMAFTRSPALEGERVRGSARKRYSSSLDLSR